MRADYLKSEQRLFVKICHPYYNTKYSDQILRAYGSDSKDQLVNNFQDTHSSANKDKEKVRFCEESIQVLYKPPFTVE